MLYTYAIVVSLLFIGEIVVAGFLIANPEAVKKSMKDVMDKQYENYGGSDEALTRTINLTQRDLQCCGVIDSQDWKNKFNKEIPESCYPPNSNTEPYSQGCLVALIDHFQGITLALCISAFILAIAMIMCVIIACGLAKQRSMYV